MLAIIFIFDKIQQLLDWINKKLPQLEDRSTDGTLKDMQVRAVEKTVLFMLHFSITLCPWEQHVYLKDDLRQLLDSLFVKLNKILWNKKK